MWEIPYISSKNSDYEVVIDPQIAQGSIILTSDENKYGGLHIGTEVTSFIVNPELTTTSWKLTMTRRGEKLGDSEVGDFFLVLGYQWIWTINTIIILGT